MFPHGSFIMTPFSVRFTVSDGEIVVESSYAKSTFPIKNLVGPVFLCVFRFFICNFPSCKCAVMLPFQIENESRHCFFAFMLRAFVDDRLSAAIDSDLQNAFTSFAVKTNVYAHILPIRTFPLFRPRSCCLHSNIASLATNQMTSWACILLNAVPTRSAERKRQYSVPRCSLDILGTSTTCSTFCRTKMYTICSQILRNSFMKDTVRQPRQYSRMYGTNTSNI